MDTSDNAIRTGVQEEKHYPVSFTGSGGEFFKIWIVNILLTIITLYIYSAWAKVRTKRYFHGNTLLDGSSFEYHAKPLQILLSRLIAAALFVALTVGQGFFPILTLVLIPVLFLIIPWAIWRSTKFNMRMTSYRNVRFGFDGSVWPLYLYMFIIPLLGYAVIALLVFIGSKVGFNVPVIIALGVILVLLSIGLSVFTQHRLYSYFFNHYLYGKSRFTGDFSFGKFFKIYAVTAFLGLVTFAVFVGLLALFSIPEGMTLEALLEGFSSLESEEPSESADIVASMMLKFIGFFYAYIFLIGFFLAAFVSAKVRNHVYGNALLDNRVGFESDVPVAGLWWVMFSNLLLVIITLGFAIPYARVRMAKFMASHTKAISSTPLDQFVGEKREEIGAFGDELGDAFDMDLDVGF